MMEISGKTNIVGLIGWPTGHSVSPAMHNAAFAELGLDWRYVPLPVPVDPPERIGEAVRGLRALGLRGANVTVPHKQAVMPHLDQLSPAAQAIGAVNTIRIEPDGSLLGDNTDAPGFVADLRDHGVDPAGKRVLVLGAGGSARAVVYGLATAGSRAVAIANRSPDRAQSLAAEMQHLFADCRITAHALPDAIPTLAGNADLIINTTSLGMTPKIEGLPWDEGVSFLPGQVVYDLVYNPPQTRLLQKAAADGAKGIGGLGMLIWQGAIAFELWTGQQPSTETMRRAALADLRARGVLPSAPTAAGSRVRRATASDAAQISALNAHVHQLHVEGVPHIFKPTSSATFPASEVLALMENPNYIFLIAEDAGEAVGYVYLQIRRRPENAAAYAQSSLYIEQISVQPSHQHKGYGAQLIAGAKSVAHEHGLTQVTLDVWRFNTAARAFFEQQGFQIFNYRMWLNVQE